MTDDPLKWVLRWLDISNDPTLGFNDFRRWRSGTLERFVEVGLLREIAPTDHVNCDGCEGQELVQVDWQESELAEQLMAVGLCRECGRVEVEPRRLRRFEIRLGGLARVVASSLGLARGICEDLPGRVWFLGPMLRTGQTVQVFLARGLSRPAFIAALEHSPRFQASQPKVVLTPHSHPSAHHWRRPPLATASLAEILKVTPDGPGFTVDRQAAWGATGEALEHERSALPSSSLTVTECAELLLDDVSGLDLRKAKARISKAASAGKFRTNGKLGPERRIERDSFSTWRLQQREKDLDES